MNKLILLAVFIAAVFVVYTEAAPKFRALYKVGADGSKITGRAMMQDNGEGYYVYEGGYISDRPTWTWKGLIQGIVNISYYVAREIVDFLNA